MKRFYSLLLLVVISITTTQKTHAQIFSQDFSSSSTVSNYVNATTPNSGQWNAIGTSGSGTKVSITSNALAFSRTSGNAGSFSRTTAFSPAPTGMVYSLVLLVSGNTTAKTNVAILQVGSGFGTANSAEANANVYARFGINFTATDGTFQLRDIGSTTNSSNLSGSQVITWYLNNTGSTVTYTGPNGNLNSVANDTYDLWAGTTIIFDDLAVTTPTQSMTDLKFAFEGGIGGTGYGTIVMDNFLIYGASDGALPVELTSFISNVEGNKVELNWRTATEVNNYGFEIERSQTSNVKSETWEKIGFVRGNGNSNSPKNYYYTDQPTGGREFKYRLKQIDFDGTFEYSFEITATLGNVSNYKLDQNYPNPFNPVTKISYTIPQRAYVHLHVYDMLAKQVAELVNTTQESGRYEAAFDGSNLPSGAYFYKLEAGNYIEVKKLLLVK